MDILEGSLSSVEEAGPYYSYRGAIAYESGRYETSVSPVSIMIGFRLVSLVSNLQVNVSIDKRKSTL